MKLNRLANAIGARVHTHGRGEEVEIRCVKAGDRISDLLYGVSEGCLVVTHLTNLNLTRLIELMDVPALCLLNGATPDLELLDAVEEIGAAVMVSPDGMFETCGRLYAALRGPEAHPGGL